MTHAQPCPTPGLDVPHPWQRFLCAVALLAATLAVYHPVGQHPFINLDDRGYVITNAHIRQLNWDTVKWSFTTFRASNWHPLTWLSHAVDYHFYSLNAGRHHDTNLLLHALNAVLLFWILAAATGYTGRSFVVAALFALHPINVESVAWIAERKNLLSMFFFLLALGAYGWYARKPGVTRYLAVAGLFVLALMSKPQVITLPFVLLLWDYWPLGRFALRSPVRRQHSLGEASAVPPRATSEEQLSGGRRIASSEWRWLLLEKLPLLALSVPSAIVTVIAQRAGGTMSGSVNSFSFLARFSNALLAYVRYLGYAVWPSHLAFFYPHARFSPQLWQIAGAALLLLLITLAVVANRKHGYLAVGWLWFLGTMVPMIGLVQVGSQAMADRYAYLPFVGLFVAVSWGVADWAAKWRYSKVWLPAGTIAVLLLLSLTTRRQLSYWSDDLTLWMHSAQVVQDNWMAENMIGEDLLRQADREAAIPYFRAAAEIEPLFPFPHLHIGIYEEEHHHPKEALQQLKQVIDLTQPYAAYTPVIRSNALTYMSYAYNQLGDYANQQKYMSMAAQQLNQ